MRRSGEINGGQRTLTSFKHSILLAAAVGLIAVAAQAQTPPPLLASAGVSSGTLAPRLTTPAAMADAPEALRFTPNARRRIVVNLRQRKLALIEDGRVVKIFRVAVGARTTPTPAGSFQVINRVEDPTWYGGADNPGVVVPPGPENPLGTRWIGLSLRGYGIHGTNVPGSIGKRASHGCIRMHKADVEALFELVRPGDVVELHSAQTAELARIFGPAVARPVAVSAKPAAVARPGVAAAAAVLF